MIGRKYMVVNGNSWFDNETEIEILDHRLRRSFKENFVHYAQVNKDYVKNDTPSSQVTYQYEFVVKYEYPLENEVTRDNDGRIISIDPISKSPTYSTHNDMLFLDFLSEFCEELDKKAEF